MKPMNWKRHQAEYIRSPRFANYGMFAEKRPVKVDCSLGINPGGFPLKSETLTLPVTDCFKYPHKTDNLKDYICSRWSGVNPEEIVLGTGSEGILNNLGRILGGGNVKLLGVVPQFIPALMEFAACGVTIETLPLTQDAFDVDVGQIIQALTPETTVVYLDNPHNPTGSALPRAEVEKLAQACAEKGVLLIVDEAYGDFVPDEESALHLKGRNLICLRSFSKGCGMAGLRVGYGVIRDEELRRCYAELSLSYAVSDLSIAVTLTALEDLDIPAVRENVMLLKKKVMDFIKGYPDFSIAATYPSTPIFLLTWKKGGNLYDKLMEVGIQTEAGHFFCLEDNSVRLRTPQLSQIDEFCRLWEKAFGR